MVFRSYDRLSVRCYHSKITQIASTHLCFQKLSDWLCCAIKQIISRGATPLWTSHSFRVGVNHLIFISASHVCFVQYLPTTLTIASLATSSLELSIFDVLTEIFDFFEKTYFCLTKHQVNTWQSNWEFTNSCMRMLRKTFGWKRSTSMENSGKPLSYRLKICVLFDQPVLCPQTPSKSLGCFRPHILL